MTYSNTGRAGAAALVAAAVLWAVVVTLADAGSSPGGLTRALGLLNLALLAVGMGALVKMMVDLYGEEEL